MFSDINYGLLLFLALITWISLCVLNAHNFSVIQASIDNVCPQIPEQYTKDEEETIIVTPVPKFTVSEELPILGKIFSVNCKPLLLIQKKYMFLLISVRRYILTTNYNKFQIQCFGLRRIASHWKHLFRFDVQISVNIYFSFITITIKLFVNFKQKKEMGKHF